MILDIFLIKYFYKRIKSNAKKEVSEVRECLDVFITDEDRLVVESVRNFVNKEINPIREEIEKARQQKEELYRRKMEIKSAEADGKGSEGADRDESTQRK